MQKRLAALFLVPFIFLSVELFAADAPPMAAGLWEISTTPEFKGIPANPIPKIDRICLDEQSIRAGAIPVRVAVSCKITSGHWDGKQLSLVVACQDAPPDTKVPNEFTATDKTISGYIALNAMITYRYQGTWLSDECK